MLKGQSSRSYRRVSFKPFYNRVARVTAYHTNQGCMLGFWIIYPVYIISAEIIKPETLLAPSKVENPAPIALNKAVMHIVVAKTKTQNVKKDAASIFKPTMK